MEDSCEEVDLETQSKLNVENDLAEGANSPYIENESPKLEEKVKSARAVKFFAAGARVGQGIAAMRKGIKVERPTSVYQSKLIRGRRCDKAREDEDMIMTQVTAERKKNYDGAKEFLIFLFSDVGLMVLCLAYAIVGAKVFIAFELPNEEQNREIKKNLALDVIDRMNYMTEATWMWHTSKNSLNQTEFYRRVERDASSLVKFIAEAASNNNYDGEIETWDYAWTFPNTLLFTITIMTTVGYGHISPKTFEGQIFCIFYSLIGLPLFMFFMANIGNPMADGLKYTYSRICCRFCRAKRRRSEFPHGSLKLKKRRLIDDVVGEEYYMPTDLVIVPIILCLLVITGFLGIGTFLFHHWEKWDLVSAAYFSFVTLSTIGFGDYVPSESFIVDSSNPITFVKMTIAVSYTVIGMALLSMTISLIQEGVTLKAQAMKNKMGFGKTAKVKMDTVSIQKRRETKDGCFIMDTENDTEGLLSNVEDFNGVDDFNDVETQEPSTSATSLASIKESVPGTVDNDDDIDDSSVEDIELEKNVEVTSIDDVINEEMENLSDMD